MITARNTRVTTHDRHTYRVMTYPITPFFQITKLHKIEVKIDALNQSLQNEVQIVDLNNIKIVDHLK